MGRSYFYLLLEFIKGVQDDVENNDEYDTFNSNVFMFEALLLSKYKQVDMPHDQLNA